MTVESQQLGISKVAAIEILNMQWRRFTRAGRQEMQALVDKLRDRTWVMLLLSIEELARE